MTIAQEKHYRIKDLVALWGFSRNTLIKQFASEPGVIKLTGDGGKRKYVVLSVPESVAVRVHQRLSHDFGQTAAARNNPLRVVHLRDTDTGVTKKL